MGNANSLFYSEPLHLVRGEDVWLYDAGGKKYLDVYNNVAHVGHSNPYVVEAITKQAKNLNTNTRYLHENIVDLAEKITKLMPGELSVCYFVCSGSEANDLALQIARAYTRKQGCLVSENAYHGNTTAVFQMSPEDCAAETRQEWVQTLPNPKKYQQTDQIEVSYIKDLSFAMDNLDDISVGTAAVIFDSIFSSDGIFLPPSGYLKTIYGAVRTSGGLAIADEVQSGFGRTGTWWGYQLSNVSPDIAVMGKPMGSGLPVSGVIATEEISDTFHEKAFYFNTTAATPLQAAVAGTVIDIIQDEKLIENAEKIGGYLKTELLKIKDDFDYLGDIRGPGLFIGLDIVDNKEDKNPDKEKAIKIVEILKSKGVLISNAGQYRNVLKLRPPLVFDLDNAKLLLETLNQAFREVG